MPPPLKLVPSPSPSPEAPHDEARAPAAFARCLPAMQALPADAVLRLNLDVGAAIVRVLGSLPALRALAGADQGAFRVLTAELLDGVEERALALLQAHSVHLGAGRPASNLRALRKEGFALRDLLRIGAQALAAHGLLDGQKLATLHGRASNTDLAMQLTVLAEVLGEAWPKVSKKTALERSHLERADELAERILEAAGRRGRGPNPKREAADVRRRAYTLLVEAHEEVRRAVTYLRWHEGDAEKLAPSLYGKRKRRRAREAAEG